MNFNKNSHPSPEQISDLINPLHVSKGVSEHVAGCSECNMELKRVKQGLSRLRLAYGGEELHAGEEHLDDAAIKDYVKERLDEDRVKSHIQHCDDCRQAVLLFRAQRLEHMQQLQQHADVKSVQSGFEEHVARLISALKWKNDWAVPFWLGIPMGAVTAILVVLMLVFITPNYKAGNTILVTYRDDPSLYWSEVEAPDQSLGFYSGTPVDKAAFDQVDIKQIAADELQITWPEVEGARGYKLSLYQANPGKPKLIYESKAADTQMLVKLNFSKGQRYIWQISGQSERLHFATQGGFLFSSQD